MYKEHPNIKTPEDDIIIWRYIDLWKFLDIIDNDKLYMSRADQFEDKLEGRIPHHKVRSSSSPNPLKQIDTVSENVLKKHTFISSWNANNFELYPLWKIYTESNSSIAIKSTIIKLKESIKAEETLTQYIGQIKYVRPDTDYTFEGNTFQLFFEKRDYFAFENEVRILVDYPYKDNDELLQLPNGIKIDIDPEKLIDEILLAPGATQELKELIENKLSSNNLKGIDVSYSDI